MDCVFCKIIKGEIPSYKIYEDEYTYAFLDIAEDVDGHTLIIPKNHVCNIFDCQQEDLNHMMITAKKIAHHYVKDCHFTGCNILNANGITAQQSVMHFHIHLIPRKEQDGIDAWPHFKGTQKALKEMQEILKY